MGFGTSGKKKEYDSKIWVNTIGFPSSVAFSKFCVTVEAKIITQREWF